MCHQLNEYYFVRKFYLFSHLRETWSYRFGLIDKSQHSSSDNIVDDILFIKI